jgi:hypothetical protein
MKSPRLTEAQISRALRARLPARADASLRERILDEAAATLQQRPFPVLLGRAITLDGLQGRTGRDRTRRWTLVLVAAAVLALVASAIFVGTWRPSLISVVPTPSQSSAPSISASPSATPTATSSSTAFPTAEVSPAAVAQGLHLTWTKVAIEQRSPRLAWVGDRFALVDNQSGAVFTSVDGVSWDALQPGDSARAYVDLLRGSVASWQDTAVGWWNPQEHDGPDIAGEPPITARDVVQIVRPSAAPTSTTPFKGRIESIGIGPAGIVAEVHSDIDWDAWVTKKLGARSNNAWVKHLKSVDYRDGILQIKLDNGPGLKVVWAADGREPGDYQDKGFAWYSPDGEQWTAIPPARPPLSGDDPTFPMGSLGGVVGVSDGFIAEGDAVDSKPCPSADGCEGMWHSSDGLTWRHIANVPYGSDPLLPWMGGALVTDGVGRFDTWTSQGRGTLPMAVEIPAPSKDLYADVNVGPLGLVSVRSSDRKILFTRDGVAWTMDPMPADMAAGTIAVGERSVLLLGTSEDGPPSLWLGSIEP